MQFSGIHAARLQTSSGSDNGGRNLDRYGMSRKKRRLTIIGSSLAVLGLALGLVLHALNDAVVLFHAPSDVEAKAIQPGTRFRLAAPKSITGASSPYRAASHLFSLVRIRW